MQNFKNAEIRQNCLSKFEFWQKIVDTKGQKTLRARYTSEEIKKS